MTGCLQPRRRRLWPARSGPLSAIDADLLIVPWFQGETAGAVPGLDAATGGELGRALASKEFQAKPFELFFAPITDASWRARRVAVIGGGGGERGTDLVRKLAPPAGWRRGSVTCSAPRSSCADRATPPISRRRSPKG